MKYAYEAKRHIDWAHEWQVEMGDTEATGMATTLIAQALATLALAEQQRIANQIAMLTYVSEHDFEPRVQAILEAIK